VADLPRDPPTRGSRGRGSARRTLTVSAAALCALLVALPAWGLIEALAASPVATVLLLAVLAALAALALAMLASLLVAVAPVAAVALGAVWLGRHLERRHERRRSR
jgi:cation transporter-like permease